MVIYAIIVNILLAFKLFWDYRAKNIKKRIINHELSALIDIFIYFVSAWYIFFWDAGGWILLALTYRWILFDLFFNLLNKDRWDHYGESSKIDRLMNKAGKYHILIKLIPLIISLWLIN